MSKVEVSGQIIHKSEVQTISDKFKKQEVVVCVSNGRYDDYIKFEAVNDAIIQVEKLSLLTEVFASGYLQGRKYTDAKGETRYMTNIRLKAIFPSSQNTTTLIPETEETPF